MFSATHQFKEDRYFKVDKPKRLCNPVGKNVEGVTSLDGHLTCYEIKEAKGVCDVGGPSGGGGGCDKDKRCAGVPGSGWCVLQDNADEVDGLYVNQFGDGATDGQHMNIKDANQLCAPSTEVCGPVAQCTANPGDLELIDACSGAVVQSIAAAVACDS